MKSTMRQMLLSQVVVHPTIPLPLHRAIDASLEFTELSERMPDTIDGVQIRPPKMPDLLEAGGPQDVANMIAVVILQ